MTSMAMRIHRGGDGMSGKSIISNAYLEDIGDAIRQKKETDETYYPSQMGDAIRSIEGIVPSGTLAIDAEGTYDVTQYAEAVVDVPEPVITSLTVAEDGTYSVPQGVDGYNPVTVNTGVAELQDEIDSAVEASGCDPLVEGITALTAQANAKTGVSDATLADAVGTLISEFGNPELWKTITLSEDHVSPSIANPVYWRSFFGISEQDILDGYIFLVATSNNAGYLAKTTSWYIGNGIYFADKLADGIPFINAVFARTPFSSGGSYRADYYAYANAGTLFKIYRFKLS